METKILNEFIDSLATNSPFVATFLAVIVAIIFLWTKRSTVVNEAADKIMDQYQSELTRLTTQASVDRGYISDLENQLFVIKDRNKKLEKKLKEFTDDI